MLRAKRMLAAPLCLAALTVSACTQVEEFESSYEPSSTHAVKGSEFEQVTFTAEAARRAGVRLAAVRASAGHHVIPYAALIYDDEGGTYAYVSPRPLAYLRTPIDVRRITGGQVVLEHGPPLGARVVTVGAAEVYSAEFGVEED